MQDVLFVLRQLFKISWYFTTHRCMRWHSRLRHCATIRKVAGSIHDGVIGIFYLHNPSDRSMAQGSTQPLPEMSTGNIPWGGKGGRCLELTNLPSSCVDFLEIWEPHPPGTFRACPGLSRPVQACNGFAFTFTLFYTVYIDMSVAIDLSYLSEIHWCLDLEKPRSDLKERL